MMIMMVMLRMLWRRDGGVREWVDGWVALWAWVGGWESTLRDELSQHRSVPALPAATQASCVLSSGGCSRRQVLRSFSSHEGPIESPSWATRQGRLAGRLRWHTYP